ncbi:hypothetical protein [Candidatus Protochlamydia phocaeensis]|uniref:hypothetical protein n=1 Tax=Candidatus Protochlamydia phocaeensis TaxID=1414722 RepID=UPI00083889BF|nr:hypothetical protein [Candidatus Protochlamydia phocaeensis]
MFNKAQIPTNQNRFSFYFSSLLLFNLIFSPFSLFAFAKQASIQQIATIGAPTTGPALTGMVGASKQKRCKLPSRSSKIAGLIETKKPSVQPGVPSSFQHGTASLTFNFTHSDNHRSVKGLVFTPVIVKPDGTTVQGISMGPGDSPQALIIPAPAQIGIYSLFLLADSIPDQNSGHAIVEASASTHPDNQTAYTLLPFSSSIAAGDQFSADYVYSPNLAP